MPATNQHHPEDLTYIATPQNEDLDSLTVRVVGVRSVNASEQPDIEVYRNGERVELERPYRIGLKHAHHGGGNTSPSLRLSHHAAEQIYGIDTGGQEVHVCLDREWKKEFREYAEAARQERYASARAYIEEHPDEEVTVSRRFGMGTYYHVRGAENENVKEYLNDLLRTHDGSSPGLGPDLNYEIGWENKGTCEITTGEIMRRADEKRERERKEREEKEREERERREAEAVAANGRDILRFHCELKPHKKDLSGEILNGPAPNGGAFLMRQRLPKEEWQKLKDAGAWYWSNDDLEQFDMFWSAGGWRYKLEALEAALSLGYAVQVDDALPVTEKEDLRALFFEEEE